MEKWLASHAPTALHGLNPPARMEEIAQAEAVLGITFPADVRATFLIHNGQQSDTPWLLDGWEFLSLERIINEWSVWKDLVDGGDFAGCESESTGETLTDWWNAAWIPLTYDGAGDHHCLDLSPGPQGQVGQIIQMWHDDSSRPVVAANFHDWLAHLTDAWEASLYGLSAHAGGIIKLP